MEGSCVEPRVVAASWFTAPICLIMAHLLSVLKAHVHARILSSAKLTTTTNIIIIFILIFGLSLRATQPESFHAEARVYAERKGLFPAVTKRRDSLKSVKELRRAERDPLPKFIMLISKPRIHPHQGQGARRRAEPHAAFFFFFFFFFLQLKKSERPGREDHPLPFTLERRG